MITQDFLSEQRVGIEKFYDDVNALGESEASHRPDPSRWSIKEVIGHLLDSASNNHQRFIRLQLEPSVHFPAYEQRVWVETSAYQSAEFKALLAFWLHFNLHLIHVLENVADSAWSNVWTRENGESLALDFIATDYFRHLWHHVEKIRERIA